MPQQELVGMKLLSIGEFGGLTGLGRTTIYSEIAAGRLLAVKVGRRTLVPAVEAARWLAALPRLTSKP